MTANPTLDAGVRRDEPPRNVPLPVRLGGWALFLAAFTGYGTSASWKIGANSDNAVALLIAKDIADGNLLLEDWILSTQSFLFSDNAWTALVIAVFGYAPIIVHVMPALWLAITAMFSILLVAKVRPGNVILLAPFVLLPGTFTTLMANELATHCGIYAIAAGSIYLMGYVSDRRLPLVLIPATLGWGLVASSDELFLVIFVLPAIVATVIHAFLLPTRRHLQLAAAAVATLGTYAVAGLVVDAVFRFEVPGVGQQGLASLRVMLANTALALDGLRLYFGIAFSGGVTESLLSGLRLLFLAGLVTGFLVAIVTAWRRSVVDTILLLSAVATVGAFVASTMPVDVMSSRYLFFAILAALLFVARTVHLGRLAIPAFVLAALLALSNLSAIAAAQSPWSQYRELAEFLHDNGLKRGYAGFWESHVTTIGADVHVAPVWADGRLRPFYWLTNTRWYGPGRTFFLTSSAAEKAAATAQFGEPLRTLQHGAIEVLVWDEIPMPVMGFSATNPAAGSVRLGRHEVTADGIATVGQRGLLLEETAPSLPKGRYRFTLEGTKRAGDAELVVDTKSGALTLRQPLAMGSGRLADFEFVLSESARDLRIRLPVRERDDLTVRSYAVVRVRN